MGAPRRRVSSPLYIEALKINAEIMGWALLHGRVCAFRPVSGAGGGRGGELTRSEVGNKTIGSRLA